MVEVHRQRIDTVDDGLRLLDELMTLTERLTLDGTAFTILDDLHATAEHALDFEDDEDEAVDFRDVTTRLRDGLEAFATSHTDPDCDDGFAFEYTLADMLLRMKMLRTWINEAQLAYDRRALDV